MKALRTRSLLGALLVLGQLAGLWHGLEHAGHHDHAGRAVADDRARHHGATYPLAHHHALDVRPASGNGGERDDALCGLCLIAAAGVALVDTTSAVRSSRAPEALPGARDVAPPERRERPRSARAPPPLLS